MAEIMTVNGREYTVLRLLGKGKGGYSYLVERDGQRCVLKQIHHEPCDYYTFGNKLEAEKNDYRRLVAAGIRVPRLIEVDEEQERILKEYIDGPTVQELAARGALQPEHVHQGREMAAQAKRAGLNIDYYPTNFILQDGLIWYIDYECNAFMEEWSFDSWGEKYWRNADSE